MLMANGKGRRDEMEDRFRDRRGLEHYDNGRYAPGDAGDSWIESRRGRDSRGRFTSEYREPQSRYEVYREPYYDGDYGRGREFRPMNKIGFAIGGDMEHLPREFDENFRENEMANRSGRKQMGYGGSTMLPAFDRNTADEWVNHMENADGTTGPHWSFEQAQQIMTQRKINRNPACFYAALNAVYSDFCGVAKKHGVSNIEFFADLANAWLDDKDAVPNKAAAYYEYVVKH